MSLVHKRVGVIAGGRSSERGISLKSGRAVRQVLSAGGLNAVLLEVQEETEEEIRLLLSANGIDLVFVAMHGGFGEDGRLQGILEKINCPYTGPGQEASRTAMDKIVSRRLFEAAGLCVPRYRVLNRRLGLRDTEADTTDLLMGLHFPLVVKPSSQGSSIGISFVGSPGQFREAVLLASGFGGDILAEEFIRGREITVAVFDGRALPIVEIIPKNKFFDYEAKYQKGLSEYICPAVLDEGITRRAEENALRAYHILGCRHFSRVDMIVGEGGLPYILEVNTIPGMTEISLFPKAACAAGMDFYQLCAKILELALL